VDRVSLDLSGLNDTTQYEPWKPEQFCTVFDGLRDGQGHVSVAPFPVAWRMEMVHDERYRGCEYVR